MPDCDIAIIGGGGAGLTAAIYTARARRETVVFEHRTTGGQIATTDMVENFPGFPAGINGFDLAFNMLQQAERFGAKLVYEGVTGLTREADGRFRLQASTDSWLARAIIVTAGAEYNKLGVPGEEAFTGKGVSWCATCDAAFFKEQDVVVVGGGDAALDEGLFLTRYVRSVTLVHRRETLRASRILQERARASEKFRFRFNTVITAIRGDDTVAGVDLEDTVTHAKSTLAATGVFVFIGQTPSNALLKGLVPLDPAGHALVDLDMSTAVPGLFVAGDLRARAARQLVAACGDGATAAIAAEHFLSA